MAKAERPRTARACLGGRIRWLGAAMWYHDPCPCLGAAQWFHDVINTLGHCTERLLVSSADQARA